MDRSRRRAAAADWKARKRDIGVFALRCPAEGRVWVGAAPDLAAARRRLSFSLRMGRDPHQELQAAWTAHGEAGFAFEVLERLDEEKLGPALDRVLRERRDAWRAELDGRPL